MTQPRANDARRHTVRSLRDGEHIARAERGQALVECDTIRDRKGIVLALWVRFKAHCRAEHESFWVGICRVRIPRTLAVCGGQLDIKDGPNWAMPVDIKQGERLRSLDPGAVCLDHTRLRFTPLTHNKSVRAVRR